MKQKKFLKKVTIRRAIRSDFREIAEIWKQEFRKKPYYERWTSEALIKVVRWEFRYRKCYVIILDEKVIGFLITNIFWWINRKCAYIEHVAILKKFQGKGIGSLFLKNIEKLFRKKGVTKIYLEVHTHAKALGFYKNNGYTENGCIQLVKYLRS